MVAKDKSMQLPKLPFNVNLQIHNEMNWNVTLLYLQVFNVKTKTLKNSQHIYFCVTCNIIQLFHAFVGNSQIYCHEVLWMTNALSYEAVRQRSIVCWIVHSIEGQ